MNNEEKSYSKIQTFFFVVFIPVVFTLLLCAIVLSFLGLNVVEKGKEFAANIPVLSSYVQDEEELDYEAIIADLEAAVAEKEKELERLERELEAKEEELSELELENERLEQQLELEGERAEGAREELAEAAKMYEAMSPKSAAAILAELDDEEAIRQLRHVSVETRARILAKMDSEKAARLMTLLAKEQ